MPAKLAAAKKYLNEHGINRCQIQCRHHYTNSWGIKTWNLIHHTLYIKAFGEELHFDVNKVAKNILK